MVAPAPGRTPTKKPRTEDRETAGNDCALGSGRGQGQARLGLMQADCRFLELHGWAAEPS